MTTPPVPTSRPHLNEWEHTWAYVAGGGITLIMLAFGLAAMRNGANEGLYLMLVFGVLLLVGGTIGWLVQLQPWKNFDDLTTPFYTGHAHHDDHAADHATPPIELADDSSVQAAIAELASANVTVGEPYTSDFEIDAPIVNTTTTPPDLPPPPVIVDPMSAFPEPPPEPAAPTTSAPDDLTRIKGIGPKINSALKKAGITTFAQLADMEVAALEQVVRAGDVKSVIHPENWIADSKRVASGDRSVLENPDQDRHS